MFLFGGFAYGLIEVLWRGYSHWSMVIAGGLSFLAFSVICRMELPLLYKCIMGSLTVTAVELVFGLIVNRWLGLGVWDYSEIHFNLFGQICLLFSVLWGFLSLLAVPLSGAVSNLLDKNIKKGKAFYELSSQSLGRDRS